jgi:hypothetical protein
LCAEDNVSQVILGNPACLLVYRADGVAQFIVGTVAQNSFGANTLSGPKGLQTEACGPRSSRKCAREVPFDPVHVLP